MDLQTPSKNLTGPGYPTIEVFSTNENFKYLWLKYVVGFDLSVHCAKCLKGAYSRHFGQMSPRRLYGARLNEAPAHYYYLCGVTTPYRWKDNLHLVFRYKPGSQVTYDDGRTGIVIKDAERIEIQQLPEYPLESCGCRSEYHTCRNWRFAYQIVHGNR